MLSINNLVGSGFPYHVEADPIPRINKVESGMYKLVIGTPLNGFKTDFVKIVDKE